MYVLGIETSCDETAFAVVKDGTRILSNQIASQADLHALYGGVVPEVASRRHIEMCTPLLQAALNEAKLSLEDIDLIAVTNGPGLVGALLVGVNFAQGLALATKKPLVGVNHVEAHLHAACMENKNLFPAVGVVISGGHTSLVWVPEEGSYSLIGQTQDDAIGEAFDKVAALLELAYPGGPEIEKLAMKGDAHAYPFKPGNIKEHPFDFSFSGLKTAVLYKVKGQNRNKRAPSLLSEQEKADVAASFQRAAFTSIVNKTLKAADHFGAKSLIFGGGVSNSRTLRALFDQKSRYPLYWPPEGLSLDNGAMIAALGYASYKKEGFHALSLPVLPRIPFSPLSHSALLSKH